MKRQTIVKLNRINRRFYRKQAVSFGESRAHAWPGWKKLLPMVRKYSRPVLVDVGCGNGRWLKFMIENEVDFSEYVGLDASAELLEQVKAGKGNESRVRLVEMDLLELADRVKKTNLESEVITVMGVMHHLPGSQFRTEVLETLLRMLKPKGIMAVSYWQIKSDSRFAKMRVPWENYEDKEGIDVDQLEEGDCLLTWQGRAEYPRYVHSFTDQEVEEMNGRLEAEVVADFKADGRSGAMNRYVVYVK